MHYLDYILEKLNLIDNIVGIRTTKLPEGSKTSSKTITKVSISNKNIKPYLILYSIMAFMILIVTIWLLFFEMMIINNLSESEIISINNIKYKIILFISIFVFCVIYVFLQRYILFRKKEAKPTNINIYNRELPENLTPAHARLLVLDGAIDAKTIACTILDLVDRKYLELECINREELFTKDLLISKTNKSQECLFEYEKYLINWFFEKEKISSFDLREKLNNHLNNPGEKFSIFQGLIFLSFPLNNYYESNNNLDKKYSFYKKLFAFSSIVYIISIFITNISLFGISALGILFGLANLLFVPPAYLLNEKGAEMRDGYLDLKKYLTDFSLINEKTAEMITLWNYYLSYSIALDMNGVANDEINNFFGDDIYNINNSKLYDENEIKKLIENIPNEIRISKNLYKKRNIN